MDRVLRYLSLHQDEFQLRTARFDGREHLVAPVVMLMEGVIWPSNSPTPELVTLESFARTPGTWNNEPVTWDHPPFSAGTPEVMEEFAFGQVFNSHVEDTRLVGEVWLDPARAKRIGGHAQDTLDRIVAGEGPEVSVGAFVEYLLEKGTFEGKPYGRAWLRAFPDHLALLPQGDTGACSKEMGCGIRAASGTSVFYSYDPPADALLLTGTDNGTLPAPGVMEGSNPEEPMTLIQTLRERFKGLGVFRSLQGEEGMSDVDLRQILENALRATEPGFLGVEAVFQDTSTVAFAVAPEDVIAWFTQAFTIADSGEVTFSDRVEVAPVTRFEPVAASEGGDTACECDNPEGATLMDERIKALIANPNTPYTEAHAEALKGFGEEGLALLEEAAKAPATPVGDPPPDTATPPKVEAAPPAAPPAPVVDGEDDKDKTPAAPVADPPPVEAKAPTWEDTMKAAPAHMRRRFAEMEADEKAEHDALVATLSAAQESFTDEELGEKDVPELRQLAAMIQPDAPAAPINFGARGVPNQGDQRLVTAPKPPSLTEAVQARRKAAAAPAVN